MTPDQKIDLTTPEGIKRLKELYEQSSDSSEDKGVPVTAQARPAKAKVEPKAIPARIQVTPAEPTRRIPPPTVEQWKAATKATDIAALGVQGVTATVAAPISAGLGYAWKKTGWTQDQKRKRADDAAQEANIRITEEETATADQDLDKRAKDKLAARFLADQKEDQAAALAAFDKLRETYIRSGNGIIRKRRQLNRNPGVDLSSASAGERELLKRALPYVNCYAADPSNAKGLLDQAKKVNYKEGLMEPQLQLVSAVAAMRKYLGDTIELSVNQALENPQTYQRLVNAAITKVEKPQQENSAVELAVPIALSDLDPAFVYLWKYKDRMPPSCNAPSWEPVKTYLKATAVSDTEKPIRSALLAKLDKPLGNSITQELQDLFHAEIERILSTKDPQFKSLETNVRKLLAERYAERLIAKDKSSTDITIEVGEASESDQLLAKWNTALASSPQNPHGGTALYEQITSLAKDSEDPEIRTLAEAFLNNLFEVPSVQEQITVAFNHLKTMHDSLPTGVVKQEIEVEAKKVSLKAKLNLEKEMPKAKIPSTKAISEKDLRFAAIMLILPPEVLPAVMDFIGSTTSMEHGTALLHDPQKYSSEVRGIIFEAFSQELIGGETEEVEKDSMFAKAGVRTAANTLEAAIFEKHHHDQWIRALNIPAVREIYRELITQSSKHILLATHKERNEGVLLREMLTEAAVCYAGTSPEALHDYIKLLTDDLTTLSPNHKNTSKQPDFPDSSIGTIAAETLGILVGEMPAQAAVETLETVMLSIIANKQFPENYLIFVNNPHVREIFTRALRASRTDRAQFTESTLLAHEVLKSARPYLINQAQAKVRGEITSQGDKLDKPDGLLGVQEILMAMGVRRKSPYGTKFEFYTTGEARNDDAMNFLAQMEKVENYPPLVDRKAAAQESDGDKGKEEVVVFSPVTENVDYNGVPMAKVLGMEPKQPIYGDDEARFLASKLLKAVPEKYAISSQGLVGQALTSADVIAAKKALEGASSEEIRSPEAIRSAGEVAAKWESQQRGLLEATLKHAEASLLLPEVTNMIMDLLEGLNIDRSVITRSEKPIDTSLSTGAKAQAEVLSRVLEMGNPGGIKTAEYQEIIRNSLIAGSGGRAGLGMEPAVFVRRMWPTSSGLEISRQRYTLEALAQALQAQQMRV